MNIKKTMAWLLTATMLMTNVDYVHAAETVYESQEIMTTEVSQGDSAVVEVSANCTMDALSAEILYSGTEAGITWSITADGLLTIGGTYDAASGEKVTRSWLEHKTDIKKAVVTARNVEDTTEWFMGCSQLTEIDFSQFDTANVTSMTYMFYDCCALTSLNLSGFDTGKVTNMSFMFDGCSGLTSVNLSGFDTSSVTTMWYMFSGCSSLTGLDLSDFKTGNVTNMAYMFKGCSKLSSLDLSGFDSSKVTNMSNMFDRCSSLTSLNLSDFETGEVTNMSGMFYKCSGLTGLDVSSFDTSKVTKMSNMFYECSGLTSLDLSNFNTSKVTGMFGMFASCTGLTGLNLSNFNTSKVTSMSAMFFECSGLTGLDLGSFITSSVTDMSSMFAGCTQLTGLDLSNFDTSKVTNMSRMFYGCCSLTGLDLSKFNTGEVTSMSYMFDECSKLARLDLSSFNTSKLSDAKLMVAGCEGLLEFKCMPGLSMDIALPHAMQDSAGNVYGTYLPKNLSEGTWLYAQSSRKGKVSGLEWTLFDNGVLIIAGEYDATKASEMEVIPWHEYARDIESVTVEATGVESTANWFDGCSMLQKVNLSQFDTSKVTNMEAMFQNCYNLKSLDVSDLNMSKVVKADDMFLGCTNLDSVKTFKNLSVSVGLPVAMYDDKAGVYKECPLNVTEDLWIYKRDIAGEIQGITWMLLKDGTLVLGGSDTSTEAFVSTTWPWHTYKNDILKVKIYTQNVKSTACWFLDCANMTAVDLAEFNASNIQNMQGMFKGCSALETCNLSGFDTSLVTDMSDLFCGCVGLKKLDLSTFDLSKLTMATGLLNGCTGIQEICMPANISVDIAVPIALYNYLGEIRTDVFSKYQPEAEWYYAVNPVGEGEIHVSKVYPQIYTGKAIKPEIRIYDGANSLLDKKDFAITYKNNTNVASRDAVNDKSKSIAPTIVVTGKGNYTKTETITFDILAKDVADTDIIVNELVAVAGKKMQTPVPTLTYNGKKLVNKKDFIVSYPDLSEENPNAYKDPGTYRVVVTGTGNFTGERTLTFTIGGMLMSKTKIDKIANQTYTGSEIEPEIKVTHGKKRLVKGADYTVHYNDNVEIGKATVTVTGMGDYAGSKTATFQITGQSIVKANVEGIVAKTYNGKAQSQNITVTLKGQNQPLVSGTDYEVAYTQNINVGTATMTIKGIGAYTGTIRKSFKINAYDLHEDESKLLAGVPENLKVTYEKGGNKPSLALSFAGTKLVVQKDYVLSYANNTKVTTEDTKKSPTIVVKGKGNFKGTINIPFSIIAKNFEDVKKPVKISVADLAYSKTKGRYVSKPVLTDSNGKKLVAGTDYEKTVIYTLADGTVLDKNNVVEAGQTVIVTVIGKGNYSGTISATYRVTTASFKSAKIEIAAQVYSGKEIALSGEDFIVAKMGKDTLVYGEDFEIVEGSYKNNVKKGTASVTIKGKGNYGGEKNVKFKIVAKEIIWFWRLFE